MLERVCLAMEAICVSELMITGRIQPVQDSTPATGRSFHLTASRRTSSKANQKLGIETKNRQRKIARLSFQEYWWTAA